MIDYIIYFFGMALALGLEIFAIVLETLWGDEQNG